MLIGSLPAANVLDRGEEADLGVEPHSQSLLTWGEGLTSPPVKESGHYLAAALSCFTCSPLRAAAVNRPLWSCITILMVRDS